MANFKIRSCADMRRTRIKQELQRHALKRLRARLPKFHRPEQIGEMIRAGRWLEWFQAGSGSRGYAVRLDGFIQVFIYNETYRQVATVLPDCDDRVKALRLKYAGP